MITKVTKYTDCNFEYSLEPIEESIKIKETDTGYEVRYITLDEYPDSPRNWDNLGKIVCFHKKYTLPNESGVNKNDFSSWGDLLEYLQKELDAYLVLPIYMYDHSGVTISTYPFSCAWDSGQIGFIYVTKEDIDKELNGDVEKAKEILESEIKIYDQYLRNEVYTIVIETYDKDKKPIDYDCCSGYYGYKETLDNIEELYI